MPNAAFYRSQAEAFCKLAEAIEEGGAITPGGQILAEELRELARQYYAEAARLDRSKKPVEARAAKPVSSGRE